MRCVVGLLVYWLGMEVFVYGLGMEVLVMVGVLFAEGEDGGGDERGGGKMDLGGGDGGERGERGKGV